MSDLLHSFSMLFVPEEILKHFDVINLHEQSGVILIDLEEKGDVDHIPKEIVHQGKVVHNGWYNSIEIQTYPAQGKEVFLKLKRRRWKFAGDNHSYGNDYSFCNEGTKATKEFGVFLKEIGR